MESATTLSRCGLGARPGRQLLRLRADPVRPAAVPGLCPSAPESVSPVRLSSALLVVTLRRLRNARLSLPLLSLRDISP